MIHARFLPKYPKRINVTGGLTKSEANGIVTLGFDYENSEFGAELAQAVATTAANAVLTANDVTAADVAKDAAEAARDIAISATSLFATKTAAAATHPATAPPYMLTEGYASVGDGGAALYKSNGGTTGDIVITLSDGTTLAGYDVSGPVINAAACGVAPAASAAANLAALKKAVLLCPVGGEVLIPPMGVCSVDTSGGLSNAITIDKQITIRIDGHLKATYSAYETNPAYMFKVTADDVVFVGSGTIEGDGAFSIVGTTTLNMPGLVYVESADNFSFSGIKCYRGPQTNIMLAACNRAVIHDCEMQGGPITFEMSFIPPLYTDANPSYAGSAYFGIVASGGGDHTFSKIHFTKDADGGRFINCIFPSGVFGNSNGNKTLHCIAYNPFEKLLYGYGDKQVVAGNTVYGGGTASVDTHTEAIRIWGSDCRVYGNVTDGCRSAMQVLDGARNTVFGNTFKNCRSSGVNVQHFSDSYTGGIASNVIRDNYISRDGASVERRFGVRILSNTLMDLSSCEVSGNTLIGWGDTTDEIEYTIDLVATSPRNATNCVVKNNRIESCGNGIRLTRNIKGHVASNDLNACTSVAIHIEAGARCIVENNTGESPGTYFLSYSVGGNEPTGSVFRNNFCTGVSNIAIRNHTIDTNNIWAEGNQWTNTPLHGRGTLAASAATTVTHGGIAAHAAIDFWATSQNFAARQAGVGLYTGVSGNDFSIATGDGSSNAGGEVFRYRIIQ